MSHSHHRAVGFQTYGMIVSRTDGNNVPPAADIALAILNISHSHHRTVDFQAYGVTDSRTDSHNVPPAADIAPAIIIFSHSHHRAVGFQAYGATVSRADGNNVPPAVDIALAILIISHSHHGTVGFQAHSMNESCADGNNVPPVADIALALPIISHSHHSAVVFQAYGVIGSRADHVLYQSIPAAPLARVFHKLQTLLLLLTCFLFQTLPLNTLHSCCHSIVITCQLRPQSVASEPDRLLIIAVMAKRLFLITKRCCPSDLKICQQLSQIGFCALRILV